MYMTLCMYVCLCLCVWIKNRESCIEDQDLCIEDLGSRIRFQYQVLSTLAFHKMEARKTMDPMPRQRDFQRLATID
jgi:hypothetical protein